MNTTVQKNDDNAAVVVNYYHHLLHKNFDAMADCLHPDVFFISPLAEMSGKAAVISSAQNLSQTLKDIKIRAKFAADNRIMLAYDFMFPEPITKLRAAVLMELQDQLISRIELFFDSRPFAGK